MDLRLLGCLGLGFLITLCTLPYWIKKTKEFGFTGKDMHKLNGEPVSEIGGIAVVFGFLLAVLSYVLFRTFIFKSVASNIDIIAITLSVLIATFIGLIDDIFGWKIGLTQLHKPLLALIAAIPLMVLNLGHSTMCLPFIGCVELNFLYPLLIIPLIITGASNAFNMLAGYNGLEAKMGIVILSALSYFAYIQSKAWISMIGLCMVVALIAFWFFNKVPAKIFPGNTMTYAVGCLIGAMVIVGNMEKVGFVLFIPYFIEFILKLRGKFKKESFAQIQPDGSLDLKYGKWYGLEHIMNSLIKKLKGKAKEAEIVNVIVLIELLFVGVCFLI